MHLLLLIVVVVRMAEARRMINLIYYVCVRDDFSVEVD